MDKLVELELVGLQQTLSATSIFRFSATLRILFIENCVLPDSADQVLHFPRLKQLGLRSVRVSESSLHGLISGCAALEFLLVQSGSGFRRLHIHSLTLRSLSVQIDEPKKSTSELQFEELVIENAPSLERLIHLYTHCWNMDVSVLSSPKLKTLRFLTDWKNLPTRVCGPIRRLRFDSPTMAVHNVKSISVDMTSLSLDSIVDLMRLFPCLEKLHVKFMELWGHTNCWRRKRGAFIKFHDIRLKTLILEPYLGTSSHVNFVTFFVLNARELELMKFQVPAKVYNSEFLAEQHSKLRLDNKASRGAWFHFTAACRKHVVWSTRHLRDFDLQNDAFLQ